MCCFLACEAPKILWFRGKKAFLVGSIVQVIHHIYMWWVGVRVKTGLPVYHQVEKIKSAPGWVLKKLQLIKVFFFFSLPLEGRKSSCHLSNQKGERAGLWFNKIQLCQIKRNPKWKLFSLSTAVKKKQGKKSIWQMSHNDTTFIFYKIIQEDKMSQFTSLYLIFEDKM